jgi:hypothetical protein
MPGLISFMPVGCAGTTVASCKSYMQSMLNQVLEFLSLDECSKLGRVQDKPMHLVQQSDLHRPGWPRHDSFWQDLQLH